jgi:hypothetical protein
MRSKASVSQRAQRPDHMHSYCRVIGCGLPARAGTSKGLDTRFCRRHADHYSRHGSPYKRSYSAKALKPYRKIVQGWLRKHKDDRWVANAVERVNGLFAQAGPFVEAFRLAGLPPRERARKAWARLRHAGVDPMRVVESWLVVELAVRLDPQPDGDREFKRVQGAKLIHRLASGSHKRWELEPISRPRRQNVGTKIVTELHKYPHSRGKVLRYIGADMEEACGLVVATHLPELLKAVNSE